MINDKMIAMKWITAVPGSDANLLEEENGLAGAISHSSLS